MILSPELQAALARNPIERYHLVTIAFPSQTVRLWQGFGPLRAVGHIWRGTGALISLRGIGQSTAGTSRRVTMTLSGVSDEQAGQSVASYREGDVLDSPVTIDRLYIGPDGRPVQQLLRRFTGLIAKFTVSESEPDSKTATRTVSVSIEIADLFAGRSRGQPVALSNAWMQTVHPGALGLVLMPQMTDATIRFPEYL